jgi:hypothetical protein
MRNMAIDYSLNKGYLYDDNNLEVLSSNKMKNKKEYHYKFANSSKVNPIARKKGI